MPVPTLVDYDRYADLNGFGLISQTAAVGYIGVNGVALVTWWLSNAWSACQDPVTTVYTDCFTEPSTTWTTCEDT